MLDGEWPFPLLLLLLLKLGLFVQKRCSRIDDAVATAAAADVAVAAALSAAAALAAVDAAAGHFCSICRSM